MNVPTKDNSFKEWMIAMKKSIEKRILFKFILLLFLQFYAYLNG